MNPGYLFWQLATENFAEATDLRGVTKAHHWHGHSYATKTGKLAWQSDYTREEIPGHGTASSKSGGGGGGVGLRNYAVNIPTQAFHAIGYPPHLIKADCIFLHGKHPDQFKTPEEVRSCLDFAFGRPDHVYPAHGPEGFFSVVREGENHIHAVVDLRNEKGQYRVKHITLLDDAQLRQHLNNLPEGGREWHREPK